MELYAATDGPDTDFMVKLVDVYPDGYEAVVLDNPIRARFRYGRNPEDEQLMTPGLPAKFEIDLWHTAITFEKGHRIAVHVTSSNYPRFDVNPNTGVPAMESRVATNTIFHDAQRPSAIVLPVVAAPTGEDTDD
jgi:putative CocE/NonD family hydrolase